MHWLRIIPALTITTLGGSALADSRPVSIGPYAQADMGAQQMVAKAARLSNTSPSFALHVGTDLFSWLSVGGRLDLASHEIILDGPPQGEFTQFYGGAGEARLSLSISRIAIYAEGSLGYSMVSTNLLETVNVLEPGERFSPTIGAGGGLEYQLQNRHYSLGVGGHWTAYPEFARISIVSAAAHLRYTY